jgi:hypothetical protein
MEVIVLDTEFLRGLGLSEEALRPQPEPQAGEREWDLPQALPMAGPSGLPAELLSLSEAELEKLLKEEHTQENPYVYCMPNGRDKAAVYPDKPLGEYDLEYTANQFIILIALARDPEIEGMLAYKPRHGRWHSVDPNPTLEMRVLVGGLDISDRRIIQLERRQQA